MGMGCIYKVPTFYNFMEQSTKNPNASVAAAANSGGGGGGGSSAAHVPVSTLDPKVSELVELIFDEDTALNSIAEAGVQVDDEFGLSSITDERLARARGILEKISKLLHDKPDLSSTSAEALAAPKEHSVRVQVWRVKLEAASNSFNQQIPAIDPVQLDTAARVDDKMKMLDTLDDIAIAQQLGVNANASASAAAGGDPRAAAGPKHPTDAQAEQLKCAIAPLKHSSKIFKAVAKACKAQAEPPASLTNQLCGFHNFRQTPEVLEVFEPVKPTP